MKKPKPITITIEGELAEKMRSTARAMGVRPTTFAYWCARGGELMTSPTTEGADFRLASALHELRSHGRQFVEVRQPS